MGRQQFSSAPNKDKLLLLFKLIFFFSGFASLIYQVAWQRILTLYYGVGSISITIIVSVYMAGLGFGAIIGGRLAERVKNRILLYFTIETAMGVFGAFSLLLLQFAGRHTSGADYWKSFLYIFLLLCIPTILMGATLPLLSKIINTLEKDFTRTVSILYFINTLGAAAGCLAAGYIIISLFGLGAAIFTAAATNFAMAFIILKAIPRDGNHPETLCAPPRTVTSSNEKASEPVLFIYIITFVSGFIAIGYEIIWFRIIGVLVKSSPYAFSSILSVYLLGIATGSLLINKLTQKHPHWDKRNMYFACQFLIGLFVIIVFSGFYHLTAETSFSKFPHASFSADMHPLFIFSDAFKGNGFAMGLFKLFDIFIWPFIFIFPAAFLMGASFPLIASVALKNENREGETVGTVYFFMVAGNVFGGIVTGFVLLPSFYAGNIMLAFSIIFVLYGFFITSRDKKNHSAGFRIFIVIAAAASIFFFPKGDMLYKVMHVSPGKDYVFYSTEGIDSVVVSYHNPKTGDVRNYINGCLHGITSFAGYSIETDEAMFYAPRTNRVFVLGYGSGKITEAVLKSSPHAEVTIVEISPTLIVNLKKIPSCRKQLSHRRIHLHIDDARRFLLRDRSKYDLFLMDPLLPTAAYSNNVYSKEFFSIARRHLNGGGILMAYMGENRVFPKTIASVFPRVRMYAYSFCLASDRQFRLNRDRRKEITSGYSEKMESEAARYRDVLGLFRYEGDEKYVASVAKHYPINTDLKPVNEYYLGLKIRMKLLQKRGYKL